jgi:hypothetical protein
MDAVKEAMDGMKKATLGEGQAQKSQAKKEKKEKKKPGAEAGGDSPLEVIPKLQFVLFQES